MRHGGGTGWGWLSRRQMSRVRVVFPWLLSRDEEELLRHMRAPLYDPFLPPRWPHLWAHWQPLLCPQPVTSWSVLKGLPRMSSAPLARPSSYASNNTSGTHPSWSPPMTGEHSAGVGGLQAQAGNGGLLFPCWSSGRLREGNNLCALLPTSCNS